MINLENFKKISFKKFNKINNVTEKITTANHGQCCEQIRESNKIPGQ